MVSIAPRGTWVRLLAAGLAALAFTAGAARLVAQDQPPEGSSAPAAGTGGQPTPEADTAATPHESDSAAPSQPGHSEPGHAEPGHAEPGHAEPGHAGEEGHGGGHHDPFDLSHGNATANLENPAEWRFDMAIYTFIVFLLLLAVLLKFAWGPIMKGLEKREQSIAHMIEEARANQEKSAKQLKEYEARLALAAEEAQEMVNKARRDAEAAADRIRGEAELVAQKERARAVEDIRLAKEQALQEVSDRVAENAFLVARRILGREINPEDHTRLIKESLERLPSNN